MRRHDLLTAVTSSRDVAASRRLNCCCVVTIFNLTAGTLRRHDLLTAVASSRDVAASRLLPSYDAGRLMK